LPGAKLAGQESKNPSKKSVDISQAAAYTDKLILKVIFRTVSGISFLTGGGAYMMNERDRFLLGLAARTARAPFRGAKSLKGVSNVVVLSMLLGLCSPAYSQTAAGSLASDKPAAAQTIPSANSQVESAATRKYESGATARPESSSEVEVLRSEVAQLRAEIERLRSLVEAGVKSRDLDSPQISQAGTNTSAAGEPSQQNKPADKQGDLEQEASKGQGKGAPQSTAAPEHPRVVLTSKAQGGDLSGAGNLLRTDRITIGGYGDFQFRQSSISERADGGGTPTFQNTRMVLGIAAVLAEKQNIFFNSEIEYEFGSREIDIEQAYLEWKVRPEFAFRGGVIVPSIGRFNTYHDSYLNLTTIRPLINQFIVPTAYRDAGIGVRGRFKLPHKVKLTYEADVVNGMRGTNNDGEATPFSRLLGQSSASEPGLFAFQAQNRRKAVIARIGLSLIDGLELGASVYNGRFSSLGEPAQSATIVFLDASYHRGALAIRGEYGRSNIVGGIPRKSPAPPVVDTSNPESVSALAEFVAQRTPGQDGFYLESTYKFSPRMFEERFDEGFYIAPVFRYEAARLDRTIPNFYLNRSRATVGLNLAPSSSVIFKLNYLFNHTFGPVPNVPAGVGGALFGASPLPHLGYGRNGFTGSIAYVF
jgi:hypothetical protein